MPLSEQINCKMNKILVFDNYDSFTYNLVHLIEKISGQVVDVVRNDKITLDGIAKYDKIVLSPGPGLPDEAGILKPLIERYANSKQILGVCLGHQAIGEVFGATLLNLTKVYHGVATQINVVNKDEPLFRGMGNSFMAGRYHSWIIDKSSVPSSFEVTAVDENGQIMAISHKEFNIKGVQFHPESILTPLGEILLSNWLSL